jgi:hypothetical protein
MADFISSDPTLEDHWRAIILFGQNVASYKFALAQTLLELADRRNDLLQMDDLAGPFARNLCKHLGQHAKQSTSPSSKFLDACKSFNAGEIAKTKLIDETVRLGFVNVIDAFHVVNREQSPQKFFIDERVENSGVRLTDNLFKLAENREAESLGQEVEARWNLVETAWDLNISRNLIQVSHDNDTGVLFVDKDMRRIDVTSSRAALNGYQKGKCFYCFGDIDLNNRGTTFPDVDHFFPFAVLQRVADFPVNGIWNLVLACQKCNRGDAGKFAKIPDLELLVRLNTRNEFLIASHHPLRETLLRQTGFNANIRRAFLQKCHDDARSHFIHLWSPAQRADACF